MLNEVDSMELALIQKAAEDALFCIRNSSVSAPSYMSVTYPVKSGNDSLTVKVSINEPDRDSDFALRIESACHSGNQEEDHCNADDLLLELLKRLDCNKTVEAFKKVEKWYA